MQLFADSATLAAGQTGNDVATLVACARFHVDCPVAGGNCSQFMLDDDHEVAGIHQAFAGASW